MQRLTKKIDNNEYDYNKELGFNEFSSMDIPNAVYNKLGQFEDIIEEYHIESFEELEDILCNASEMRERGTCGVCKLRNENFKILEDEISMLKGQIEQECKEHRITMEIADNSIKTLSKALELAIETLRYNFGTSQIIDCYLMAKQDNQKNDSKDIKLCEFFKEQAKNELEKKCEGRK